MPDDTEVVPLTTYKLESLVPTATFSDTTKHEATEHADALGMYLLDLMKAQEYEVVGGVRYEVPEPEVCEYPTGWCVLRALVDVREFDVNVDPDEGDG